MRQHYPLNSQGAEDAGTLPWTDGVPSTGTEGSYFGHALFTDTEAEILAAIDAAGLVHSGSDLTQLIQAASRGIWLGQFGGTANALTATVPNNLVIPSLQAGMRVRGIAASNFTGTGGTLKITGIGTPTGVMTCPLVGADGTTALASGAWKAGQFLTFDIDASGNARFAGGGGALTPAALQPLLIVGGRTLVYPTPGTYTWTVPAGVYVIEVELWGAGGSGSGGNQGFGGGPGGYSKGAFAVTPGDSITIAIGAGGAVTTSLVGNNGTTTSVSGANGPMNYAYGGTGGQSPNGGFVGAFGVPGSSGGMGCLNVTSTCYGGAAYAFSTPTGTAYAQGVGGAAPFGGSAGSVGLNALGTTGNFPGGGGNGSSTNGANSGAGGSGLAVIRY